MCWSRRELQSAVIPAKAFAGMTSGIIGMTDDDPFLWLEEVEGDAALQWVRRENGRSLAALEADPRHQAFYRDALAVVTAADRIPYPRFVGDRLANFWQDAAHVRGLWRTTSLASFATPEPDWQTLLDVDALAAAEGRNWVYQGASVLPPAYRRGLVSLSDGEIGRAHV